MSNIKKWNWWLNSGGGAQAFDSPAPLQGAALDTSATFWAIKVGQDSFNWYLYESDGTTLVDQDLANVSNTKTFSGLTPDTNYIAKCEAVSGSMVSPLLEISVTTIVTPLHYFLLSGLKYGATNAFGKCTTFSVDELYSFIGTPKTLTPVGTKSVLWGSDTKYFWNKRASVGIIEDKGAYVPSVSNIQLSGEFTVIFKAAAFGTLSGTMLKFLWNSVTTDILSSNSTTGRLVGGGGDQINIAFSPAPQSNAEVEYVYKRDGSNVFYVSSDGGATFTNVGGYSGTFDFNRVWFGSTVHYPRLLAIYDQDLTTAQIRRAIDIEGQAAFSTKAIDASPNPKGLTFAAFSGSPYLSNANFGPYVSGGASWTSILTKGDYDFIRTSGNTTIYSPDYIYVRKVSTNEIAGPINLGTILNDTNDHNIGSLFFKDNTLYHMEFSRHYGLGGESTYLVVKRFGVDWNFHEFTILPKGNDIVQYVGSQMQYPQYCKGVNYDLIVCQEFTTFGRWITILRSKDNFNSFEKIRIIDTLAAPTWVYHRVVYAEDGVLRIRLHRYINGSPDKITWGGLIVSDDDGDTIRNINSTWSQNVGVNALGVSIADAVTNCTIDPAYTVATNSIGSAQMYYDPTDGMLYGLAANGTDDGLNLNYWNGGAWVIQPIDTQGLDVIYAMSVDGSQYIAAMGGQGSAVAVRKGGGNFSFFVFVDLGSSIWKIVELSTADYGANCTVVGNFSSDDSKLHVRMEAPYNMHYTGSSPYNGNKTLIASKNLSASLSDLMIKSI